MAMAWGEEKCVLCDAKVNGNGIFTCRCDTKLTYRKEPTAPLSAPRAFFNGKQSNIGWGEAVELFYALSAEDRQQWEEKAALDLQRFEKEKMEYNRVLQLDDDIREEDCRDKVFEYSRRRGEQRWARYRRDHPKFNPSVEAVGTSVGPCSSSRFLDLPRELRDRIYRHYFDEPRTRREFRQWQLVYEAYKVEPEMDFSETEPFDTRILAVNHQVYAEALDVLYSHRTRCFVVDITKASVLPLFVRHATGTQAPRPTLKIRRWHVYINLTNRNQVTRMKSQLQQLCDVMEQSKKIEEITFTRETAHWHWEENKTGDLKKAYWEMLNQVLDNRPFFATSSREEQQSTQPTHYHHPAYTPHTTSQPNPMGIIVKFDFAVSY
ncbi:MAG: hypothetical protein LQ350_000292 [Teloschistes chrysophthalmus]|nr:MAG: hypothetical protein LQ350_000292 [Niorma chrysophthalma]